MASGDGIVPYGVACFARLDGWQDRPLLANGPRALSAQQIARQAASIAQYLRDAGVQEGDVGLICLRDPIDTILAFLAHWYLGASPLVLDFRLRQFRASGARIALVDPRAPGRDLMSTLAFSPDMLHGPAPRDGPTMSRVAAAAPAMMLASSGTTGSPKIYAVDFHVMKAWGAAREVDLPLPQGLALCALPLQYVASLMLVLRNLLEGLPVRFHPVLSGHSEITEALLQHPVVHTALPPSVIRRMAAEVGPRDVPLLNHVQSLRSSGGPALPDDKIAAFHNLSNGYNMSFGSGLSGFVSLLAGQDVLERPETSGRIHAATPVEIIGPDGHAVPAGESGALRIHTRTLSRIVASDQSTSELLGDGWCMTGDVAMVDGDGFLTILGRSSDMILRGGVSISATELEAVIAALDGVREVAVIGVDDPDLGQEVGAVVVAPGLEFQALRRHCVEQISPDKRPRRFALVDSLPYSANGKLLRRNIDAAIFGSG
ncbi:MAG: AMP-binding protein [Rhodobacteraceae bacterium]|nr:AMP-binding protein [Paracoccaceae bacterium]